MKKTPEFTAFLHSERRRLVEQSMKNEFDVSTPKRALRFLLEGLVFALCTGLFIVAMSAIHAMVMG